MEVAYLTKATAQEQVEELSLQLSSEYNPDETPNIVVCKGSGYYTRTATQQRTYVNVNFSYDCKLQSFVSINSSGVATELLETILAKVQEFHTAIVAKQSGTQASQQD